MRILPIAYYLHYQKMNDEEIVNLVNDVSSITHAHEISVIGCYIYVRIAMYLLDGYSKEEAYNEIKKIDYSMFKTENLNKYDRILKNDISKEEVDNIKSTGYIVDTLEAVLWVLFNTYDYNQTIIKAINLGGDTDTIGAIVGGLAGIIYGIDSINSDWKKDLIKYDYIIKLCEDFDTAILNNF